MKLTEFVCSKAILTNLNVKTRDEAIKALVEALDAAGKIGKGNAESIMTAVVSRENEASTGIGKGVAVPHVKDGSVNEVVAAIGLSPDGLDFSSLDKKPVYSVILLVSPKDNPDKHLQAMETVFKSLQKDDFRRFLRQAQSIDDVTDLLSEVDDAS